MGSFNFHVLLALAHVLKRDDTKISMAPAQGWGFLGGSVAKNPSANTRDAGDRGLIPGLGRPLEKEMAARSSILAGKIL